MQLLFLGCNSLQCLARRCSAVQTVSSAVQSHVRRFRTEQLSSRRCSAVQWPDGSRRCSTVQLPDCSQRCSSSPAVRVRFAPSPTGHLHLGGLRTALYNYLFARAHGGTFILRLEDTDQTRLVPGAGAAMESVLCWAGLPPDESPGQGGQLGPYTQSERLHLYREAVDSLLASGRAYRCFCSSKRLDLLKREAARTRQANKYDRKCYNLSREEVEERLGRGEEHTVRFLLTPHPEPWQDLVYGPVTHDVFELEGDPIILKSDGFPTYHLASVVDDHLMEISHVLRGVEWQASTPKHLLLYRALDWQPPQFGHLPLLVNSDGTKLSKRQGDMHIERLVTEGFFPEAVTSFVSLVGGGFEDREYSLDDCVDLHRLSSMFQLDKVHTGSGRVEMDRLATLNRAALRARLEDDSQRSELVLELQALVASVVASLGLECDSLEPARVEQLLVWAAEERISRLRDLVAEELLFLWALPRVPGELKTSREAVARVAGLVREATVMDKSIVKALKKVSTSEKLSFPAFMSDLRTILTGASSGPPVLEILTVLGRQTAARRLEHFVDNFVET